VRQMDWTESGRFLMHGTRTAKIATIRCDGRPHVVPVWFILDQGDLIFTTASSTVKARNMTRDPRVAVTVDDETPPFGFVSITGRADLAERPEDFLTWTTKIASRYVGQARGAEFGRRHTEIDDLVVRVRIESFTGRADLIG
jgi:PPOX class probable F420-dependent enzyme